MKFNAAKPQKMTTYHVINGDCLADQLKQTKINHNFIVCRECLIEGNVSAYSMEEFWAIRAEFIAGLYKVTTEDYLNKTVTEFEKLEQAYASKIQFTTGDIELGKYLWTAYQQGDLNQLGKLAKSNSDCFEYLEEVCQAHIDRFPPDKSLGRPDRVVKEIIETTSKEFQTVFAEFSNRDGIYGFGDLQIKSIYDRLMHSH